MKLSSRFDTYNVTHSKSRESSERWTQLSCGKTSSIGDRSFSSRPRALDMTGYWTGDSWLMEVKSRNNLKTKCTYLSLQCQVSSRIIARSKDHWNTGAKHISCNKVANMLKQVCSKAFDKLCSHCFCQDVNSLIYRPWTVTRLFQLIESRYHNIVTLFCCQFCENLVTGFYHIQ